MEVVTVLTRNDADRELQSSISASLASAVSPPSGCQTRKELPNIVRLYSKKKPIAVVCFGC
jgi:hypothetical protein